MALTGFNVGFLAASSYCASEDLSWEMSCSLNLGYPGHLVGQVMKVALPILSVSQLMFSSAANAAPFVAIGGTVCGLVVGGLVVNNLIFLIRNYLQTPGVIMQLTVNSLKNQQRK